MITAWMMTVPMIQTDTFTLTSKNLQRDAEVVLYSGYAYQQQEVPVLLVFNDGQDLVAMKFENILAELQSRNPLKPFVIAGIRCGTNRLQEYGVCGRPDALKRGSKADAYCSFLLDECLPEIQAKTGISTFAETVIAGFSLGGLSAFDLAWNHPEVFQKAGVFSGSFWWRSKELNKGYTDADRIAHAMVRETEQKPAVKFWFEAGTLDEKSDRNKNGIIDSVEDTTDLMGELYAKGFKPFSEISYYEMVGGRHDVFTWAKAMPRFLCWALGR